MFVNILHNFKLIILILDDDILEVKPKETESCTAIKYMNNLSNYELDEIFNTEKCDKCSKNLEEPYIHCNECRELFCLRCFSNGLETSVHKNSHSYIIRDDEMNIFASSDWSAAEEKRLLNLLVMHGFGNWEDISKSIKTRTPDECRNHYLTYYFDGIFGKTLGLNSKAYFPKRIPYLYKMNSIEPPRFDCDNPQFNSMAGYRCARGDFDTPYDPSSASLISNLNFSIDELNDLNKEVLNVLYISIIQACNNRMK